MLCYKQTVPFVQISAKSSKPKRSMQCAKSSKAYTDLQVEIGIWPYCHVTLHRAKVRQHICCQPWNHAIEPHSFAGSAACWPCVISVLWLQGFAVCDSSCKVQVLCHIRDGVFLNDGKTLMCVPVHVHKKDFATTNLLSSHMMARLCYASCFLHVESICKNWSFLSLRWWWQRQW